MSVAAQWPGTGLCSEKSGADDRRSEAILADGALVSGSSCVLDSGVWVRVLMPAGEKGSGMLLGQAGYDMWDDVTQQGGSCVYCSYPTTSCAVHILSS